MRANSFPIILNWSWLMCDVEWIWNNMAKFYGFIHFFLSLNQNRVYCIFRSKLYKSDGMVESAIHFPYRYLVLSMSDFRWFLWSSSSSSVSKAIISFQSQIWHLIYCCWSTIQSDASFHYYCCCKVYVCANCAYHEKQIDIAFSPSVTVTHYIIPCRYM